MLRLSFRNCQIVPDALRTHVLTDVKWMHLYGEIALPLQEALGGADSMPAMNTWEAKL